MSFPPTDRHNEDLDRTDPQRIRITAPEHPLHGQEFPVVRHLLSAGVPHLVIRLPAGQTQLLPTRWTVVLAPPAPPRSLLVTPQRLRALLTLVAYLHAQSPTEGAHAPIPSPGTLVGARPSDPPAVPDPVD